jgi:hypothetical protein
MERIIVITKHIKNQFVEKIVTELIDVLSGKIHLFSLFIKNNKYNFN